MKTNPSPLKRLLTGIVDLDVRVGGGWPFGAISLIYGGPNAQMTLVAQKTARLASQTCGECLSWFTTSSPCTCGARRRMQVALFAATSGWDDEVLRGKGINHRGPTGAGVRDSEALFQDLSEIIQRGIYDVIVIDPFNVFVSREERADCTKPDTWMQNVVSWSNGVVRLRTLLVARQLERKQVPAVLIVDHERRSFVETPFRHYRPVAPTILYSVASVIVRMRHLAWESGAVILPDGTSEPRDIAHVLGFTVERSDTFIGKRRGRFRVDLLEQGHESHDVARLAAHLRAPETVVRAQLEKQPFLYRQMLLEAVRAYEAHQKGALIRAEH